MQHHPYAGMIRQDIKQKILDSNRKLTQEVEDFKATELAKKIETKYKTYYKEIKTIMEGS